MPSLFDYLGYAGNALDLPASSLRDLLTGNNPFDQWATPFSDRNRATGRDVLSPFLGANEETGFAGWADNPMEGLKDIAGFGAEVLLDPLNFVSGAGVVKALRGAKAAKGRNALAAAENAANAGKYGYVNPKAATRAVNPITGEALQRLIGYTPEPERVFHGGRDWTPSATPEKPYGMFDVRRIKSGEGGQAYGPGMYASDSPQVSQHYKQLVQDRLAGSPDVLGQYYSPGRIIPASDGFDRVVEFLPGDDTGYDWFVKLQKVSLDDTGNVVNTGPIRFHGTLPDPSDVERVLGRSLPKAKLYELDVPSGTKSRFMRWEDELGGQPVNVQNVVAQNPMYGPADDLLADFPDASGDQIFEMLSGQYPSGASVRQAAPLAEAGIPGMSNPAAIVKNARNYAIWDTDLVDQMRIRSIDGQRVPINPTTLVQQSPIPVRRTDAPLNQLTPTMNPMRQMERVPSALAPAAGMTVQNILARQQGPGGIQ